MPNFAEGRCVTAKKDSMAFGHPNFITIKRIESGYNGHRDHAPTYDEDCPVVSRNDSVSQTNGSARDTQCGGAMFSEIRAVDMSWDAPAPIYCDGHHGAGGVMRLKKALANVPVAETHRSIVANE